MTRSKAELTLAPRVRAYPDAVGCAVEFDISPTTWLRWVEAGDAPPPIPALEPPRWRWADVDAWMSDPRARDEIRGRYGLPGAPVAPAPLADNLADPFIAGIAGVAGARKKDRGRGPAKRSA